MKIESLLLADAAQAVGGKLFVLGGGWNIFRAPNFPAPAQIALAIDISVGRGEVGLRHAVKVAIMDDLGVPIVPEINGLIEVGQPPGDIANGSAPVKIPLAFNAGLQVPRPGSYTIVVTAGPSKAQTSFEAVFVGNKAGLFPGGSGGIPERGQ